MKKFLFFIILLCLFAAGTFFYVNYKHNITSGAPPYEIADNPPDDGEYDDLFQDWTRPEGPARVGLQVGHWKTDEVPEELHRLRGNTGASGGGKSEWEVNFEIANLTREKLEERGIIVDILPATVPPDYWADVFVSIHADGNEDSSKTGYKAAVPRRDLTGNADELLDYIETTYQEVTGLEKDPNVTRNMRGYYAFGWWRYEHSVHPMTTSLILETGFLSSPSDRAVIVDKPELSATGLSTGILEYLESQKLL